MRRVFADTAYFIALLIPSDDLHDQAHTASATLSGAPIITTDGVLTELLAYLADRGPRSRSAGLSLLDEVKGDPTFELVRQTPALFDAAVELYRARPDKGYSLTDCLSMIVCRRRNVDEVLSHDRHFAQEGFALLL